MNIIKVIKLYNKINKIKSYLEHNLITRDIRKAIQALQSDFEVLVNLIPELKDSIKDIKAIFNV